ncbi:MAG: recombinase family protein [Clostridia bacterium]|jgi:DNA invertase Pin-like site-specific DNA recombinase|nr:recombinase family protein [Clostridia bacterium]MDD3093287.1 recombinase family protein [Clostridia bacterium]MDD3971824.1 recombinase family protein [Clostridia bacterium]
MDKKRACLYMRVASMDQSGLTLLSQEEKLKTYCKEYGFKITNIYKVFASGSNLPPFLKQISQKAENKEFDILLCTSVSRLGQNINDVLNFCRSLRQTGCELYCLNDGTTLNNLLDLYKAPEPERVPAEDEPECFNQSM